MLELRPYQVECVKSVLRTYEEGGSKYEVIVLPTGTGKTVVFSQVIHYLRKAHGMNVLIIAHRDKLLSQAAEKYRQINPSAIIGKVGTGSCEYGCEVTVASIQTICRDKALATGSLS
jgi:superfamily II DNA or RNA helicase